MAATLGDEVDAFDLAIAGWKGPVWGWFSNRN
jgi:hypothetical protein